MKTLITLALVTSLCFPVVALAQDPRPRSAQSEDITEMTFTDGSDVNGGRVGPDGSTVQGMHRLRRDSLIRYRTSWRPELLKAVENL